MEQQEEPASAWREVRKQLEPKLRSISDGYRCGKPCINRSVLGLFPVFTWLFRYDVKKTLLGDLIAGEHEIHFSDMLFAL